MRLAEETQPEEQENILPLINVVFLLLIFFMLAGALHAVDRFNVEPPTTSGFNEAAEQDPTVLIGADGRLALAGEEVTEQALQQMIRSRVEQMPAAIVRLKADHRVEALRIVEVMTLLKAAGVDQVLMLTLESSG